jgi:LysM repeat protein
VQGDDWRRYAAPAAFLLAATLAVVLIRSGLEKGGSPSRSGTATTQPGPRATTASSTTTTKTVRQPAKRFWTVQAGDTFGVISSKSGVPVSTLERLNPNVSSTSLFIGEKLRVR